MLMRFARQLSPPHIVYVRTIGLDLNAKSTPETVTRSAIKLPVAATQPLQDALCVQIMPDATAREHVNVYLIGKDITASITVVSAHQYVVSQMRQRLLVTLRPVVGVLLKPNVTLAIMEST